MPPKKDKGVPPKKDTGVPPKKDKGKPQPKDKGKPQLVKDTGGSPPSWESLTMYDGAGSPGLSDGGARRRRRAGVGRLRMPALRGQLAHACAAVAAAAVWPPKIPGWRYVIDSRTDGRGGGAGDCQQADS